MPALAVFVLMYHPSLFGMNVLHLLGIVAWVTVLLRPAQVVKAVEIRALLRVFAHVGVLFLYLFLVTLWNLSDGAPLLTLAFWLTSVLPVCVLLTMHFKSHSYAEHHVFTLLLIGGTLQGLTALAAFLNEPIQKVFLSTLGGVEHFELLVGIMGYRVFGYAADLTFTTSILQGLLAALSVRLAVFHGKRFLVYTPLLVFSAAINARIGLITFLIGLMLLALPLYLQNVRILIRLMVSLMLLIAAMLLIVPIVARHTPDTYAWIQKGFEEIAIAWTFGQEGNHRFSYFNYFTSPTRWTLPGGTRNFFGAGTWVLGGSKYGVASDIGYINDVWVGGIVYATGLYLLFANMIIGLSRRGVGRRHIGFLKMFFAVVFLMANIKGPVFVTNSLTSAFFLIYVFYALGKQGARVAGDFNVTTGVLP